MKSYQKATAERYDYLLLFIPTNRDILSFEHCYISLLLFQDLESLLQVYSHLLYVLQDFLSFILNCLFGLLQLIYLQDSRAHGNWVQEASCKQEGLVVLVEVLHWVEIFHPFLSVYNQEAVFLVVIVFYVWIFLEINLNIKKRTNIVISESTGR